MYCIGPLARTNTIRQRVIIMEKYFKIILLFLLFLTNFAGTKISDLAQETSVQDTDEVVIRRGTVNYRAQVQHLPSAQPPDQFSKIKNVYYVSTNASITDHGNTAQSGSIADVITNEMSGTEGDLVLPGNKTYQINQAFTVPATVRLILQRGAKIDTDYSLTINGAFDAGLYQVFVGDGAVSFGQSAIITGYPHWWGAVSGSDSTNAFYYALIALAGKTLYVPHGTYSINATTLSGVSSENEIQIATKTFIKGDGPGISVIEITSNQLADGTRFEIVGDYVTVKDISFSEVNSTLLRENVYGTLSGAGADNIVIDNVEINGANGAAMHFRDCKNGRVLNCRITNIKSDGIHINYGSEDWQITNCKITEVEDDAVGFVSEGEVTYGAVEGLTVTNCILGRQQNNAVGSGVAVAGGRYVTVSNNVIENSGGAGIRIAYFSSGSDFAVTGHVVISDNIIRNSGLTTEPTSLKTGLSITNSRNVVVKKNIISKSVGSGLTVSDSCIDVIIEGNSITDAGERGIWASTAENVGDYLELWTDAELTDGRSEAYVANHGTVIRDNVVQTSNDDGIYVSGSTGTNQKLFDLVLEGNKVSNSNMGNTAGKYGLYVAYSENPSVLHNIAGPSGSATALAYKWYVNATNCTGNIFLEGNQPGNLNTAVNVEDANYTAIVGQTPTLILYTTDLTANRTVTPSLTDVASGEYGHYFRIVRIAGGAYDLYVGAGPIVTLDENTWCDLHYTPSGWTVTAYGIR